MKIFVTIFSLCFSFVVAVNNPSAAQSYTFKILVSKGSNEIHTGGTWRAIKVGASVSEKDQIRVASNGYVGLVHRTGKPVELKGQGVYKATDLLKNVGGGANVINKYADFILSSNEEKRNNLQATGAVHRGFGDFVVYLPETPAGSVFYDPTQVIAWDSSEYKAPYEVVFESLFGDELKTIATDENHVQIDLNAREFQNEDNILVSIRSKSGNKLSEKYTLKNLSKADKARIKNLLQGDVGNAAEEESALGKTLMAAFYENNNLLIDAATAYHEAMVLAPDVPVYKENYLEFLLRHELKPKPKKD